MARAIQATKKIKRKNKSTFAGEQWNLNMDIDLDLPVSRVSWEDKLIAPTFGSLILILRRILEILLYVYKQKERSPGPLNCVNVFFLQIETTVKVNRMVETVYVFLDLVLASACVPFFLSFSVFFSFFLWLSFFCLRFSQYTANSFMLQT